ncbi:hypothetical protein BJV74DRAFT_886681 [Russula compacta]|nr:hypothetical protein BJV74DRAFT_886681 [Russula compacta]
MAACNRPKVVPAYGLWLLTICDVLIGQDKKQSKDTKGRFLPPVMEESEDDTTVALKLKSKRKGAQPTPDDSPSDSEEEFAKPPPRAAFGASSNPGIDIDLQVDFLSISLLGHFEALLIDLRRVPEDSSSSGEESDHHGSGLPNRALKDKYLDDGEFMDIDEDNDLDDKDSASLEKILKSECPSWASLKGPPVEALFNDDDNIIEVVDIHSTKAAPQKFHPHESFLSDSDQDRKPTANESKPEPAKPEWPEPAIKSLKDPRKLLSKSVPTNGATITNAGNAWPPEANIVHPMSGEIKLKQQHTKLQSIIRGGMQEMTKYMLFMSSYPPIESCTSLVQKWLYSAAKLEKADAIRSWLEDDKYIFPQVEHMKKLDLDNPFHHHMIISILREIFPKEHQHLFVSTHKSHPEPELPDSMIALAATAAYSALYKWHHGQCQQISFSQAAYEDVYQGHINTLQQFHKKHPNKCHQVLSTLYVAVMKSCAQPASASNSALSMLCLDEMDKE